MPSTIRHGHGALAHCFDWMVRKHPEIIAQNPLRLLKRGFAAYTEADKRQLAAAGKTPKADTERDRRLDADEEERILRVLVPMPVESMFVVLALETAMRMRECYTLDMRANLKKHTIHLERTKNGDNRQVPLSSTVAHALDAYLTTRASEIQKRERRLFPHWNGKPDEQVLDVCTRDVLCAFRVIFARAGVVDLHFLDLRHEATCRLYEKTRLSDVLIAKITGHRSLRTLQRDASLRGSDLALHLC